MVLVFMFAASWRLTVVTFVLVPCVLIISKVGYYSLLSCLPDSLPGGLLESLVDSLVVVALP
jgi:hypothetical protein